jgi:tRNA-2-methylthio-N6-dimethylallyladenosine synthase
MKRYLVQTFGCQMNVHDSRRIEEVLAGVGYERTEDSQLADLIVVNTCSVREKAEHKLLSLLGTMRPLKEERPGVVVAVAGCVAQQEGARLLSRAPHVDIVLGPDNIPELPALVRHVEREKTPIARTEFDVHDPRFLDAGPELSRRDREVSSFVTVMKGCDERCTFCIVPYTRGPERYRASTDIVREIEGLVAGGVCEVTLLGQTVNSWHEPGDDGTADAEGESRFAELLRAIARAVPGLARLRYTSPHPRHITDALVRAHAELDVLPAHVHLPVQSGSNRLLKRMLRRYTREDYLDCVRRMRDAIPGLSLTTDVIVGFPGETDEDFEATLSAVREVGFMDAFTFKFSPREGTPATRLPESDTVPDAVASERLDRLVATVRGIAREQNLGRLGQRVEVLYEKLARRGELLQGRTRDFRTVLVPGDASLVGRYATVELTGTTGATFTGTPVTERAPLPMAS